MSDTQDIRHGISRRTVARGAAWAAPALVAVRAAPALAASTHPDVSLTSALGCKPKTQGDQSKDYYLKACFTNNDAHVAIVTGPTTLLLDGDTSMRATSSPAQLTLAPGQSGCIVVHGVHTNSSAGSLTAIFTVSDQGSTPNPVGTVTAFVPKNDVGVDCSGIID